MTLSTTAALLGALVAGSILFLVRRDHLHGIQAAWWLMVAGVALVLGFSPGLVDRLGNAMGVHYPPMLLVILAIIALVLKLVQSDIELARKERRLRRLTQKMALLEYELRQIRQERQHDGAAGRPQDSEPGAGPQRISR